MLFSSLNCGCAFSLGVAERPNPPVTSLPVGQGPARNGSHGGGGVSPEGSGSPNIYYQTEEEKFSLLRPSRKSKKGTRMSETTHTGTVKYWDAYKAEGVIVLKNGREALFDSTKSFEKGQPVECEVDDYLLNLSPTQITLASNVRLI